VQPQKVAHFMFASGKEGKVVIWFEVKHTFVFIQGTNKVEVGWDYSSLRFDFFFANNSGPKQSV
jgi:hypothetical protein